MKSILLLGMAGMIFGTAAVCPAAAQDAEGRHSRQKNDVKESWRCRAHYITSPDHMDACLQEVEGAGAKLEFLKNWETFWKIDSEGPVFLASVPSKNGPADRTITMILRHNEEKALWPISVRQNTLERMGYSEPAYGRWEIYFEDYNSGGEYTIFIGGTKSQAPYYKMHNHSPWLANDTFEKYKMLKTLNKSGEVLQLCPNDVAKPRHLRFDEWFELPLCYGENLQPSWDFAKDFLAAAEKEMIKQKERLRAERSELAEQIRKDQENLRQEVSGKLEGMDRKALEGVNEKLDRLKTHLSAFSRPLDNVDQQLENIKIARDFIATLDKVTETYRKLLPEKLSTPIARRIAPSETLQALIETEVKGYKEFPFLPKKSSVEQPSFYPSVRAGPIYNWKTTPGGSYSRVLGTTPNLHDRK